MLNSWLNQVETIRSDGANRNASLHSYLLVDPAAIHGLRLNPPPHDTNLCYSIGDEDRIDAPDIKPFAVWLDSDEAHAGNVLAWWGAECFQANCLSLLLSPLSVQLLVCALRKRINISLTGGLRAQLRIADSRIMPIAWSILTPAQQLCLGQDIEHWSYTNRDGLLQCLELPAAKTGGSGQIAAAEIALDQPQEDALLDATQADRLTTELGRDFSSLTQTWTASRRWRWVADVLIQARAEGLKDPEDLIAKCNDAAGDELTS